MFQNRQFSTSQMAIRGHSLSFEVISDQIMYFHVLKISKNQRNSIYISQLSSLGQGHITRMFHNRVKARQGKSVKEVFIQFFFKPKFAKTYIACDEIFIYCS